MIVLRMATVTMHLLILDHMNQLPFIFAEHLFFYTMLADMDFQDERFGNSMRMAYMHGDGWP